MPTNNLSLIGLHLNAANHLRWSFNPTDGFPLHGFDLYRRDHLVTEPEWFSFKNLFEEDLRITGWETLPEISVSEEPFEATMISPFEDRLAELPTLDVLDPGVVDSSHLLSPAAPAGPLQQVTMTSTSISARISAKEIRIQTWGNNQLPALEFNNELQLAFDQDLYQAELEIVNLSGGEIILQAYQGLLQVKEIKSRSRSGQLVRLQIEAPSLQHAQAYLQPRVAGWCSGCVAHHQSGHRVERAAQWEYTDLSSAFPFEISGPTRPSPGRRGGSL